MDMVSLKRALRVEISAFTVKDHDCRMFRDYHQTEDEPRPTHKVVVTEKIPTRTEPMDAGVFFAKVGDGAPVKLRFAYQELVDLSYTYWLVEGDVFRVDDHDLTSHDVRALLNVQANRRRVQLENAHALQAMADQLEPRARRASIPREVKVLVWQRDQGRCVECGSQASLEFDHVIPLSWGGSDNARNLQLLCETCNRRKGASLG